MTRQNKELTAGSFPLFLNLVRRSSVMFLVGMMDASSLLETHRWKLAEAFSREVITGRAASGDSDYLWLMSHPCQSIHVQLCAFHAASSSLCLTHVWESVSLQHVQKNWLCLWQDVGWTAVFQSTKVFSKLRKNPCAKPWSHDLRTARYYYYFIYVYKGMQKTNALSYSNGSLDSTDPLISWSWLVWYEFRGSRVTNELNNQLQPPGFNSTMWILRR